MNKNPLSDKFYLAMRDNMKYLARRGEIFSEAYEDLLIILTIRKNHLKNKKL